MSLPDGFVIDEEPKLPEGFVLDGEASVPAYHDPNATLEASKPSLTDRLSDFAPGLFGPRVQNPSRPPEGVLPMIEYVLHGTKEKPGFLRASPAMLMPEDKSYLGTATRGVMEQINPENIALLGGLKSLHAIKEAPAAINAMKAAIMAYFAKTGVETASQSLGRRTAGVDLSPEEKAQLDTNTALGGAQTLGTAISPFAISDQYVPQGIKPSEPIYFDQRYQLSEKAGGYPNVQPAPQGTIQLPRFAQSSLEGKTLPSSREPIQLPQMMSEPRFVANTQGQQVDLSQLTEAERTELLRGPRTYEPSNKREAYTIPTIGEQPKPPPGYILDPTESQAQGPIESAYQAAGEAKQGGQISFEGQGIPNAGQQAQEPVSAQSGPEIAKELGLIHKEWPKEVPVLGGMQSFTDPATGLTIEGIKPNTPLEEVSRLMGNKLRENLQQIPIQQALDSALATLPEAIRKDIDIKAIKKDVDFPATLEGSGGLYKNGKILIEQGEPITHELLIHEALHNYVEKHPELYDGSFQGLEKAVDKIQAQLKGKTKNAKQKPFLFTPDQDILLQAQRDTQKVPDNILHDLKSDARGVVVGFSSKVDYYFDKKYQGSFSQQFDEQQGLSSAGKALYETYQPTRELIREKYGDSITLWRAEIKGGGKLHVWEDVGKNTQYYASREGAKRYMGEGRELRAKRVPVDDIVAVFSPNGKYEEFTVINRASEKLNELTARRGIQKVYGGAFFLDPDYWKSIGEDTKKVVESVGNLAKRADIDRQTLFDTIKRSGARADIAAKRDAVDTATFTTGIRAENHLALQATKEFGPEAMQARKALIAVVEAKGDRSKLNKFERQAAKNPEALASVQFAKKYWNKLQKLGSTAEALDQFNQAQVKAAGINLPTTESYIKRIYEQEPEGLIGGRKDAGTGSGSKIQRTYETLFDAIEAGHKPLTMDAAALIGKRTAEIQMEINKKGWINSFKRVSDPVSKRPILADLAASPTGAKVAPKGYETIELMPGTSVGVLKGYRSIFDAVTARSRISGSLPGQYALETVGAVKHSMLAFDSFHAFRIYQFRKSLGISGTYKDGLALLEYSKNDLAEAAKQGLIPDSAVAYAKEKFSLPQGDLARTDIASIGIRNGLNVARHSEAIYATFVREFPILKQTVGAFNKFVFDKLSRGAMMEAFQNEFVRQAESHPTWTSDKVAKTVAMDINFRMGSIGRQGLFKSRQMQDLMQLVFLAPRWVESMAQSEVRSVAQFAKAAVPGTEHFMKIGTLAKSTGTLLAAYFVGTQLLNYLSTGHGTWENPEDHKLEAYIPPLRKGEKAFYISPFSVVAEITHDMIRYSRHDNVIGAASRIVQNKLSPLARAEEVLRTGMDWKGKKLEGVWDRVKEAAITAANPLPLPARQTVEAIKAKEAAPIERQAMAMAGFKAEPETYGEKIARETQGMSIDKRVAYMKQAKTERTPPTRQESAVYAARAIEGDQQRGEATERSLSATAQSWLKEHSYRIPGHEDKLHVRGIDIQLDAKEQVKLESYLQAEYEKRIKTLANPNFAKLAPAIQKNVFDANMRDAGKVARGKLAMEIQKRK